MSAEVLCVECGHLRPVVDEFIEEDPSTGREFVVVVLGCGHSDDTKEASDG